MGAEQAFSTLTSAAIVIYTLQLLKRTPLVSWITVESKSINRALGLAGAVLASIGIHFAFDATAGTLVISGLSFANVAHMLWHVANQYAVQQLAYDAITNRGTV